ncbi:MAG: beta-galactosidase, partial [Victivallales bacterium]|nr:beta-galactosidase [Victivallales bacterium]
MQLEIRNDAFVINGRQGELLSGEIPYFRVPKSNWKKAMQLWKAAGGNCIASYCPWLVHEPEEGVFRFDEGDGITDISQFLETAAEVGLGVILRPGPYVYSEFRHGGLPRWLV